MTTASASPPVDPPGFVVRTALRKASWDKGFRLERGNEGGWLSFASTTAHGKVWLAGSGDRGPWFLASDHPGVVAEFGRAPDASGPGLAGWVFPNLPALYDALDRAYRLGASLPSAPLAEFERETVNLPRSTEVERLAVQRVGQDIFRRALLQYWDARCAVTGIAEPALLRASHIVPWAECESDTERLDVHNGLLLSALWDAAFDAGLVSFNDDGEALVSPELTAPATDVLWPSARLRRRPTPAQGENLRRHRVRFGFPHNRQPS